MFITPCCDFDKVNKIFKLKVIREKGIWFTDHALPTTHEQTQEGSA